RLWYDGCTYTATDSINGGLSMKTLIKNIHLITMDAQFTQFEDAFLTIDGTQIVGFGDASQAPSEVDFDTVIDGNGAIAMPGMVNTHTHVGMIPFRSLG